MKEELHTRVEILDIEEFDYALYCAKQVFPDKILSLDNNIIIKFDDVESKNGWFVYHRDNSSEDMVQDNANPNVVNVHIWGTSCTIHNWM